MTKILHISDLHFSSVTLNPFQIFSKRWIGNLNLFFFRKKQIEPLLIDHFLKMVDSIKPDCILISGDFTSTALAKEFKVAKDFLIELKKRKIAIYAVPGNHDAYTKKAFKKKAFYHHFKNLIPFKGEFGFDLENDYVTAFSIQKNLFLVLIDAACYTPYFQANGHFTFQIEQHLQSIFDLIPPTSKILLCCHFPFFQHEGPSRVLLGGKNLQELISRYSNIMIYFHGHTHRGTLCDLRDNGLPILSEPGSLTLKNKSAFHEILIDDDQIIIQRYQFDKKFHITDTHYFKRNS